MERTKLFRRTMMGTSLIETLDVMVSDSVVTPELAFEVLLQFEESMTQALKARVDNNNVEIQVLDDMVSIGTLSPNEAIQTFIHFNKAKANTVNEKRKVSRKNRKIKAQNKVSIRGSVHTNKRYHNIRTLILEDAVFKNNKIRKNIGRVMIVSYEIRAPGRIKKLIHGEKVKLSL